MSLSLPSTNGLSSVAVKSMGAGSDKLYNANIGDYVGIRGPYGNSFDLSLEGIRRPLLVGGGTGMVPIIVLAKALSNLNHVKSSMVIGARSKTEMAFLQVARKYFGTRNIFPATDDGSIGFCGLAHEKVRELMRAEKFDIIFSCGPEKMMLAILGIACEKKVPVQFSLERIMKCAIGICGSCCLGDYVLCKDGPVLTERQLDRVRREFGVAMRDKMGRLIPE